MVSVSDSADIAARGKRVFVPAAQDPEGARLQSDEVAGGDEKRFATSVAPAVLDLLATLFAADEPKADWDASGKEQLRRHGDDAVHQVGLDDVLSDFTLASTVGGQRAVGHDEARDPATATVRRSDVVDEVLNPGIVRVTDGRNAEFPPDIVTKHLA